MLKNILTNENSINDLNHVYLTFLLFCGKLLFSWIKKIHKPKKKKKYFTSVVSDPLGSYSLCLRLQNEIWECTYLLLFQKVFYTSFCFENSMEGTL